MENIAQFPQADNLDLVYQVFVELREEGLNRYTFAEKYLISDRQGAYYLNALCFIGLAEKKGKNTFLTEQGKIIQMLSDPFRKKVFLLAILENELVCDTFHLCKGKDRAEQTEIAEVFIEGTYGISEPVTRSRRARTLLSWFRWIEQQEFYIEEHYNA